MTHHYDGWTGHPVWRDVRTVDRCTGVQRRTGHHWTSAGYDWALAASKPVLENLPTAPVQAGTWKQQDTLATSRVRSFHSRW